jgi:hypothetical protein
MRLALLFAIVALTVTACSGPPLFVLEFVRPGHYYVDSAARNSVYQFLRNKIDVTEDSTGLLAMLWKALNPAIKTFRYSLDMQMCQHVGCGYGTGNAAPNPDVANVPESYFLHFAETTRIRLRPILGTPALYGAPDPWVVTIPGCPVGTPVTSACRLQFWGWDDTYLFFDQSNPSFRAWMAARLVATAESHDADGIFLDAHGPGFRSIFLSSTDILSGGMVREYGLRANDPAIDAPYNAHLVQSLESERSALNDAGRFLFVNCAAWSLDPSCRAQGVAAGGVHTEMLFTTAMSATQIDEVIEVIDEISQQRFGLIDLFGSACWWGGPTYTAAGHFSSPRARYLYWRFAAYLLVREAQTAPGHAYFDPTLCFSDQWGISSDFDASRPGGYYDYQSEWLGAFSDLGDPVGAAVRIAEGDSPAGTCAQTTDRRFAVFKRVYSDGIVLVRPRDHWDCDGYGDDTAVSVPLGSSYRLRRDDGTRGPLITEIVLRNSEAAILELP